ncbi:calcium/proton exchanger [Tautonia sociabilis]|uniref:Ca(2+)/H(+) antiporter n=1 Tax=Tautonia sociabilis TaxID=2080755 RepID=A0A432MP13_9BACT|nr:calcium/proton exchanger [Tautonia sociabilis]
MNLLLLFLPVGVGLRVAGVGETWQFIAAGLAIIPLAGLMGEATEHLAHRLGPGVGGLLNATFGNAAELIIALFALFRGYDEVVKASLTGSIIGNLLLVLGASLLAGGLRYPRQQFNRTAAGVGSTLMVLAAFGMLIPAIFYSLPDVVRQGDHARPHSERLLLEHEVSVGVCLILMLSYVLYLVFSLKTHQNLFNPDAQEGTHDESLHGHGPGWGLGRSVGTLLVATAFVAIMSEILIGAVEHTTEALGLTGIFVGVIVVAIVGNAAEHSTAILVARKNKMDLSVGIAIGSALQIALFVAPVLVFASYLRDEPMDLLFTTLEVVAVLLAVFIARMVAEDGESNWLEGAMLLMIYAILAVAFFVLPAGEGHHRAGAEAGAPPPAAGGTE